MSFCSFTSGQKGTLCIACNMPLRRDVADVGEYRRSCPASPLPTVYLTDRALRNGEPLEVRSFRPLCQSMGAKRVNRAGEPVHAKEKGCKPAAGEMPIVVLTPVYNCSVFGRCAPFTSKIDDEANPAHPCQGCDKYLPTP